MHVHMYVDAYGMCRHKYVHVYVCMLMYECMDIGTFVCIHVHVSRCVCVCLHLCMHAIMHVLKANLVSFLKCPPS